MPIRLVLPKTFCAIDPTWPLFFLAGPVSGGEQWQTEFILRITKRFKSFYAVIPFLLHESHELMRHKVEGDESHFQRLIPWERHYMSLAARTGCLVFWLPVESITKPRLVGGYAQDTRGELGEWRAHALHAPSTRLVIGAQADFAGLPQIRENFNEALGRQFHFYETMDATVEAACAMQPSQR